MSNKKQSSIEWIYNNLKSHFEHDGDLLEAVKMSFEQAKAMHKVEIMQSLNDGKSMALGTMVNTSLEQYYNEIYGGNNE